MRFVSIDIETLGTDPDTCDAIEFGAVVDLGFGMEPELMPTFHAYLTTPTGLYRGQPYAMSMHSEILRRIAVREPGYRYLDQQALDEAFWNWCHLTGLLQDAEKITIAGKNFGSFDLQFLRRIGFGTHTQYNHAFLDPGTSYTLDSDIKPADTAKCLERAGFDPNVPHTAVEDARNVIRLIRHKMPAKVR